MTTPNWFHNKKNEINKCHFLTFKFKYLFKIYAILTSEHSRSSRPEVFSGGCFLYFRNVVSKCFTVIVVRFKKDSISTKSVLEWKQSLWEGKEITYKKATGKFLIFCFTSFKLTITLWSQDVNRTYIGRTKEIKDVFWTCYIPLGYVLYPVDTYLSFVFVFLRYFNWTL